MHLNSPILIILFPIFHNFFWVVGICQGGILHGAYCPVGISLGVSVQGYVTVNYIDIDICARYLKMVHPDLSSDNNS